MRFLSWLTGDTQKLEPRVKYERSPLDKIEDLCLLEAPDSEVIEAVESFISTEMTIGQATRLQRAIKPYGGIIVGGAPMVMWIDPKSLRHVSYGKDLS